MRTHLLKPITVIAMALLFAIPIKAQKGIEDGSKYGHGQDSINCLMNLSLYREFFKHSNYKDAMGPWIQVFSQCPASSEKMYVDGVQMYRKLIEASGRIFRHLRIVGNLRHAAD